jgi:hypothetical protein
MVFFEQGIWTVLEDRSHTKPRYLNSEAKGLVLDSFQGQPKRDARLYISIREYEKDGMPREIEIGNLKKTKSSTQFFEGPMLFTTKMADLASATLPKAPPALVAPKGAL